MSFVNEGGFSITRPCGLRLSGYLEEKLQAGGEEAMYETLEARVGGPANGH
jgi:hypothetical protein